MNNITVTVIYALTNFQFIRAVCTKEGSTVKEIILSSNVLNIFKDISLYKNKIGIYNKIVKLTYIAKNQDRIEIYRNLIINPQDRRRKKIFIVKK